MEQNNMTRKEYIKEHIIWSLLVFLWFRNLLFRCIPKFTYTESLLGFVILSVIVMAICIALTWNRNRNYWNLIENIILCWGVFVCITYMNLYHTRIVYVGIATAAISLLLSMFTMPTIDMVATGRNIMRLREVAGLTVRDLQDIFGFATPQAIYKWQHGTAMPTIDNLVVLAAVLDVPMDEIIVIDVNRTKQISA